MYGKYQRGNLQKKLVKIESDMNEYGYTMSNFYQE